MVVPLDLRVGHFGRDLLGLTEPLRFSWKLPLGVRSQLAYQLRVGDWDSGRVRSDQSLLVPYDGRPLRSGERVPWTVRVWTDEGVTDWAAEEWFEMGLLEPADWTANWIEPATADQGSSDGAHVARLFRGTVVLEGPLERARLNVTAHGIYEFFINGTRVGDMELTPGFTSYDHALQVQTFDVTPLLRAGVNMLGAVVSGGWFKWTRRYRDVLPDVGLLAQLDVYAGVGRAARSGTGLHWLTRRGAVRTADLLQGEVVDLQAEEPGWCLPGADSADWEPVRISAYEPKTLTRSPAPPVRRVQLVRPIAVTRPQAGRHVVDLGQNINGWLRLTALGPAGTHLTLTHGEALDADGDVTIDHLTEDRSGKTPFQRDEVISAGREGDVFEPRHTTHGFRYARVEGYPGDLSPDDVTGVVVHTDLRRTGWFECSDERINKLHEAAVWSFRGNACDIPTDCPTRERAGWTGDWQVFVSTASFLYSVAGFSQKWLRALADDQQPNGVVWHCAPNAEHSAFYEHFPPGSAGWGDAAVIVPWEVYRAYGDLSLLDEQWQSMAAWVDYAAQQAAERRHPSRVAAHPVPAAHERYLWDTGFHWGEWLEPAMLPADADADTMARFVKNLPITDQSSIATAYLHYSAKLLARVAVLLGRATDAGRYRRLASAARAAWKTEFLNADGTVWPDTQATYVRALAFDLVPRAARGRLTRNLVRLIRAAGTHLATGFLATPYLLPMLAENGEHDLAYELLLQDTEPSWLTMIDRQATTVWEHWTGVGAHGLPNAPAGVGSLNHYSKGAVVSFLHRYVAGIQLDSEVPAYGTFRIAPLPGGGLTHARAIHESPYGRIESFWRRTDGRFTLDVTVPPGTTAEVRLPDGTTATAQPGAGRYQCALGRAGAISV